MTAEDAEPRSDGECIMSIQKRLMTLLWTSTSLAALLLTVDPGAAQNIMPQRGVELPPGVTLPPGSVILNPNSRGPLIASPPSSQEQRPGYSHTNILIPIPRGGFPQFKQNASGPPFKGYLAETPASLACIYQLGVGASPQGCNPNTVTAVVSGGSKAIAVVDAYDYPTAGADLNVFISQFGLAAANFTVIYGTGSPSSCADGAKPPGDGGNGWNIESSLDIEMAHAMAPNAHLYLVEANSNSYADLFNAESVATACVVEAGGGMVSNSWGGGEFSGETNYDSYFTSANVVYFAAAGDDPGTQYPCVSPNVICVGGTTISRRGDNGFFENEAVWNNDEDALGTGGGYSQYEGTPSYQNFMTSIVGSSRGAADLAAIADPQTGPWMYNSQTEWTSAHSGGWGQIGGTSVATPLLAGIFNFASFFYGSSFNAVQNIYQLAQAGTLGPYVTHIESGLCGRVSGNGVYPNAFNPPNDPANILADTGIPWSPCAGWGTPKDAGLPDFMRSTR
jgi:kumamolisin